MGAKVEAPSDDTRRQRVLQALLILVGAAKLGLDEDEREVLADLRDIIRTGYGRLEILVVDHRVEGINPTRVRKRKDWHSS